MERNQLSFAFPSLNRGLLVICTMFPLTVEVNRQLHLITSEKGTFYIQHSSIALALPKEGFAKTKY